MGELSFNELINLFEVQAIIRIILGALLAGLIGYERQAWKKPAGFRTHILVGESAVLVTLCGIYLSGKIGGVDATRIPAQLLSGMGFIGAGTILRDGFHVKGLTTAASLLAVTGIGLLVGSGAYIIAIIATIIVYTILSYTYFVNSKLNKMGEVKLEIMAKNDPKDIVKAIQEIADREDLIIKKLKVDENQLLLEGKITEDIDISYISRKILEIENVKEVTNLNA